MTIASSIYSNNNAPTQIAQLTPITPANSNSGVSFGDVLDAINPLQHIPVLSGIFRAMTGSTISAGAQIAGDTIYGAVLGGPVLAGAALGLGSSVADIAVKQTTGQDITGHVFATLGITGSASAGASTTPAPTALTALDTNTALAYIGTSTAAPSPQQQADAAAMLALHQGAHMERTNAQYQRVQAFDAMNKQLVKMVV